jgi:hypothetical protein
MKKCPIKLLKAMFGKTFFWFTPHFSNFEIENAPLTHA